MKKPIVFITILLMLIMPITIAFAGEIRVSDTSGKVWSLEDWQDGTRPYPKDLKQREAAYQQKWGESWAGVRYNREGGDGKYIMSPGLWAWEEFAIIPNGKSEWFDQSQALVYAPDGSEQVTAVYALTKYGIYHVDPVTKELTFAGSHTTGGLVYGIGEQARMEPTTTRFGEWATVDPVTGRVYFAQKLSDGNLVMRYVEKLLPYEDSGTIYYLPAFLDYQNMYQQLKGPEGGNLIPVMQSGKRGAPKLYVGTTPVKFGALPGLQLWGTRVLLSPDGKSAYVEMSPTWPRTINNIHAIDLQTGQDLGSIKKPLSIPDGAAGDQHNAISSLYDGHIYIVRHTGSTGGPGKLFRFSAATGNLEMLYDSIAIWPKSSANDAKNPAGYYELKQQLDSTNRGPADATTLWFATTVFQFQSPRTGAIMNGGWDNTGIPMYHDGFVTSLAQTPQNPSPGGRPEWQGQYVANFGSLQTAPDVAPNGDVYLTDRGDEVMFTDSLRQNGIRVIKLHRTDWPVSQPVNGYANQFLSSAQRESLMLEYARNYIANLNPTPPGWPYPKSQVIESVTWDPVITRLSSDSDNWPVTWADDDNLYTAGGDGGGFGGSRASLWVAKILGNPPDISGQNIKALEYGDGAGGKKGSGMLMVDSTLYMWVRNANNAGQQCQLVWSNDRGLNWAWSSWRFAEFGYCTFLNFGKNYAGARDNYVYIYTPNGSSAYNPVDDFVLLRVPKDKITNRNSYEFFSGTATSPSWTPDINQRKPVFTHTGNALRSGISYHAPTGRYLWWQQNAAGGVDTRFSGGFGVYDAPEPWGPWTTVYFTTNWDVGPGDNGNFPAKWMSSDGKTIYLVFSGSDTFSVRKATLTITTPSDPTPPTIPTNLTSTTQTDTGVSLSWSISSDPESGILKYIIYRDGTKAGETTLTSYTDLSLAPETTYTYQVSSVNGAGLESAKSASIQATTKPYIPGSELVISNLLVASAKAYEVVDKGLNIGATTYIDRSYTFTSIPNQLQGSTYIKTANEDKALTGTAFLSFDVNQDVTIYIAHDNRYQIKPTWLTSFADSGEDLSIGDTFSLFKKDFTKERITLGGNANPSEVEDDNMYIVIIVPKAGILSLKGDVNNDSAVNILDVQKLVNIILGIDTATQSSDVNSDGSVNILDVQAVVNIILGG